MAAYSLDQLVGFVEKAEPHVVRTCSKIQQIQTQIVQCYQKQEQYQLQIVRLESEISSLNGQISALYSQMNSSGDDDDEDDYTAIANEIAALEARISQMEGLIRELQQAIDMLDAEIARLQQERQVLSARLKEMDDFLVSVDEHLTENLRTRIGEKGRMEQLSGERFGSSIAQQKVALIQKTINAGMSAQSKLRNLRMMISNTLGDEPDEPQLVLRKGYSR